MRAKEFKEFMFTWMLCFFIFIGFLGLQLYLIRSLPIAITFSVSSKYDYDNNEINITLTFLPALDYATVRILNISENILGGIIYWPRVFSPPLAVHVNYNLSLVVQGISEHFNVTTIPSSSFRGMLWMEHGAKADFTFFSLNEKGLGIVEWW